MTDRSTRRAAVEWGMAGLVTVASAVVSTWPLATSPWLVPDHQDPLFSMWRLYQWSRNLASLGFHGLFSGNIFHPAPDVLLYSDAIALPAFLGAPFVLAGVPVALVYTGLVWLAALSAGLAMFACARRLSGSTPGALVAAAVFVGAPSRVEHLMHLELLWTAFLPLAVLATVHAFEGSRKAPWLLALAFAAQMLSCIYYGVFLLTLWPLLVAVEFVRRRGRVPVAVVRRLVTALALGALVAAVYALPYQRARRVVGERSETDMAAYGATIDNYVHVPPTNRLRGGEASLTSVPERRLSPGLVAWGLAGAGLTSVATPWVAAVGVTTVLAAEASRGAQGWLYPVLRRVAPPYRGLRVPARFGAVVLLGVALLAAVGVTSVTRWLGGPTGVVVGSALLLVAIGVENASDVPVRRLPRAAPPVYAWLSTLPPTVIAHTPLPRPDALPGAEADYQYFAQYHQHQLVNGNSGFYPPSYLALLERARGFPDDAVLDDMRQRGVDVVLVHQQHFGTADAFGAVVEALERRGDVDPVATSTDEGGVVRVYRLRR